jgi:hypothetical protein
MYYFYFSQTTEMKKVFLFLILAKACLLATAQNWDGVKASKDYIWGEGTGETVAEADKQALSDLTSKIVTHVSSSFDIIEEEKVSNNKLDAMSYVKSRVNTYSQITLNNTERIIINNEPDAVVGRWIKRAEVNRLFEARKARARDLIETALRAEEEGRIDDALRSYYWSFALVRSLQRPNEATYNEDGKERIMMNWIPEKMNDIFSHINVQAVKKTADDVELVVTYKGRPVSSMDYTFFDGRDWSNIYSAKDGRGVLELAAGNVSDSYDLKIEFEYRGESHIDKEIESVLNVVKSTAMKKSYIAVKAPSTNNPSANIQEIATSTTTPIYSNTSSLVSTNTFSDTNPAIAKAPEMAANPEKYGKVMAKVLSAIRTRNYASANECFTPVGLDIYNKLISYGSAKIVGTPTPTFYNNAYGVVARGVQMAFSFKNGLRKSFVEDIVFSFDENAKIYNIAFGLGKTAEQDILCKGVWDESTRVAIMDFLENYKTAYALERHDYIKQLFDDDAVIIIGNETRRPVTHSERGNTFANDKIIRYNRYTKDQYLKNLKACFNSNEFINIRFGENDVQQLKGGKVYSIQISQDYYSSSYGDKGYLFLMVDMHDPKEPVIKVRTWQPEKDPNFGLYGPGDFKFDL